MKYVRGAQESKFPRYEKLIFTFLKDLEHNVGYSSIWKKYLKSLTNSVPFFAGDGIMDMMLKPALHTYESQDAKRGKDDGGGDEPDDD